VASGPPSRRLWKALREIDRYLTSQSAWLVNYAERHRAGLRVGTALTEGTANFLVNRRMNKPQQMRWFRGGADLLLQVRCTTASSVPAWESCSMPKPILSPTWPWRPDLQSLDAPKSLPTQCYPEGCLPDDACSDQNDRGCQRGVGPHSGKRGAEPSHRHLSESVQPGC